MSVVNKTITTGEPHNMLLLYKSIMTNDLSLLQLLVGSTHKHLLNEQTLFWLSPMATACQLGCIDSVKLLYSHGADYRYRAIDNSCLLHLAAEGGCAQVIHWLLDNGLDVNDLNCKGQTPLHFAVLRNRYAAVRALLTRGALVNFISYEYKLVKDRLIEANVVSMACANDNVRILNTLLEAGAQISLPTDTAPKQFGPLHVACYFGSYKAVRILLDSGGGVDVLVNAKYTEDESTPLHVAVREQHYKTVKTLLEFAAANAIAIASAAAANSTDAGSSTTLFIDRVDRKSQTALHVACRVVGGSTRIVRLLLDNGADCTLLDKYGHSALYLAVSNQRSQLATVQMLVDKGSRVKAYPRGGIEGSLINVILNDCMSAEIIEYLLGIVSLYDVNKPIRTGLVTLLHVVAKLGKLSVVKLLLARGADVNVTDETGCTALHYATMVGHVEIVNALLSATDLTTINQPNCDRITALHQAVINDNIDVAGILLKHGADPNIRETKMHRNSLHIALKNVNRPMADLLLKHGADVRLCMTDGISPLHLVVLEGNLSTLRKLLERGAYLDAKLTSRTIGYLMPIDFGNRKTSDWKVMNYVKMMTKFLKSVDINDYLTARSYLNRGAYVDCCSVQYKTPLIHASKKGYHHIVGLLISHNARLSLKDDGPNADDEAATALHYAVKFNHLTIVRKLLAGGATYNAVNRMDETPLQLAVKGGGNCAAVIKDLLSIIDEQFQLAYLFKDNNATPQDEEEEEELAEEEKVKQKHLREQFVNAMDAVYAAFPSAEDKEAIVGAVSLQTNKSLKYYLDAATKSSVISSAAEQQKN